MQYTATADSTTNKEYPITFMRTQLGVARQACYRWLASGPSERPDAHLTTHIRQIYTELHGRPGERRIWAELFV